MTTPPSVPMPPTGPMFTGLDDLGDDDLAGLASNQDSPFEDPDFVVGGAALPEASPDTASNEIEPGVPATAEEPKKKSQRTYTPPTIVDWSKATPRKEDDFAPTPVGMAGVSPAIVSIRDFLNNARENGWWGLYYPVMEYTNRNSAQSYVTKVNTWRKGKTNVFGVRNGENIMAKCERQGDKFVLWVGLMQDPGAIGEVTPPLTTPAAE